MVEVVSKRSGSKYVYQEGDVLIDRTTDYGNPFHLYSESRRVSVIERFREYVVKHPETIERLRKENPVRLVCWCKPLPCHGDVLAELLNDQP